MGICLADFSAVKKELDTLDKNILQQNRKLRELQEQNEAIDKATGNFWTQIAREQHDIGRLDCENADREAVLLVYKTLIEKTQQAQEAEKVQQAIR